MKLIMFVNQAAQQSAKPGESLNVLRLQLPPKSDRVDDENREVFTDAARKNSVVEIQGLSDEAIAKFKGGKRVSVTIEVVE